MLYEGGTLEEVLAKALSHKKSKYSSKPSTYGKPIRGPIKTPSYGDTRKKPSAHPQKISDDQNPNATPEAIARARIDAVRLTEREIARKTVREGADETGIIIAYNRNTGDLRALHEPESGRPVRRGFQGGSGSARAQFEFTSANLRQGEIALCTAHTHPKADRPAGRYRRSEYDDIDRENTITSEGDLNALDRNLFRIGPIVIRNPDGNVVSLWGNWRGR